MNNKNNNKLYITLAIVVFIMIIIGGLAGFNGWMKAEIADHPAIIELRATDERIENDLEWTQEDVAGELIRLSETVDDLNKKMDDLHAFLLRKYGP